MESDTSTDYLESDHEQRRIQPVLQKGRRNIKAIKGLEELGRETILANKNEDERLKRVEELKKKLKVALTPRQQKEEVILDFDIVNNTPLVWVHQQLVSKLKSHQREGVRFMWEACYESLDQIKKSDGSGCILAHCMGLGKTLQVITLVHTLLKHSEVGTKTVLICCPKNTLLNWINEFAMWVNTEIGSINVYNPTQYPDHDTRSLELCTWQMTGGVCVMNYELFRTLIEDNHKNTKHFSAALKKKFFGYLCDPGPDLVVCDEGHILKNSKTKLSIAMNRIKTLRRIVLTGTPMQNHLKEYHCMVNFIKPHLLGTNNDFFNMFVNPIQNGQYENSRKADVRLMKERSHILHKKLVGCVQRFDLTILRQYLPEKLEYVLLVALTDCQVDIYRHYLEKYSSRSFMDKPYWVSKLFTDYHVLQRAWTHPYTFKLYQENYAQLLLNKKYQKLKKRQQKRALGIDGDDDDDDDELDSDVEWFFENVYDSGRYPLSFWSDFVAIDDIEDARLGNKMLLLLTILKECEDAGDKMILFSGSRFSISMVQHFLKRVNMSESENPALGNLTSTWEEGEDYLVLTGATSARDRDIYCKRFNNPQNQRLRLFIISTRAGGIGINLTAANRAVLLDVSWNPSHDIQSIFRIYRIGQTKPCFIYRLVSSGTMEERIYDRQVAKQSISHWVVDELQTARHFTERELSELYDFEPYKRQKIDVDEIKDPLLQRILKNSPHLLNGIHEHDSLLRHRQEEELPEAEKKEAWTAYKNKYPDLIDMPDYLRDLVDSMSPSDFDPMCLRRVLQNKFPDSSDMDLERLVDDMMPKIENILQNPDFMGKMANQAVLFHRGYDVMESAHSSSSTKHNDVFDKRFKAEPSIVILDDDSDGVDDIRYTFDHDSDQENDPSIIPLSPMPKRPKLNGTDSDSDDSIFLFEVRGKRRKSQGSAKRKPLKSWGRRGGREYGSPDTS